MGLTDDDLESDLDVLEDNLPAVRVFCALQTQWRSGMGGRTGLDYAVLPAVFDLHGIRRKRRPDVFSGVRVMEAETLNIWSERRNNG